MPTFGAPTTTPGWGEALWNTLRRVPQAFGPASAEAVVLPQDAPSRALVEAVATGQTMPPGRETNPLVTGAFDPQKKELYQRVYEAAQAHPQEVPLRYTTEGMGPGTLAGYARDAGPGGEVRIAPSRLMTQGGVYRQAPPTSIEEQDKLTHELLHFLQTQHFRDWQERAQRPAFPELAGWQRFLGGVPQDVDVREAFRAGKPQRDNPQHRLIQYLLGGQGQPSSLEGYTARVPFAPANRPDTNDASRLLYNAFFRQLFPEGPMREQALLPAR